MDQPLAALSDIPDGDGITITLPDERKVVLFNLSGKVYALDNHCPHMGSSLGGGNIEKGCVTCPSHGWMFDIRTGRCLNVADQAVQSYDVEIREGYIYLIDKGLNL